MTFANVGRLGTAVGKADELVALLTRRSDEMAEIGCLQYDVGVSDDDPDAVFVIERWVSAEAHQASLDLPSVRAAIAEAMPLLSGDMSGSRFEIVGSPLG